MVLKVDGDNRITCCSKSLTDQTGKDFAVLLGTNWNQLLGELEFLAGDEAGGIDIAHAPSVRCFAMRRSPLDHIGNGTPGAPTLTLHGIIRDKRLAEELEQKICCGVHKQTVRILSTGHA
ncbi:MAG: hypothetical protein ACOY3Z_07155 [Thermodesulfobacteriota bacterium]